MPRIKGTDRHDQVPLVEADVGSETEGNRCTKIQASSAAPAIFEAMTNCLFLELVYSIWKEKSVEQEILDWGRG